MAGNTTYELPQYIGELFQKAERPNALLRLIGGLTGSIRTVQSVEFAMGVDYSLPAAAQPSIVEGATPTAMSVSTNQSSNVVQIFQEAVEITYSRQGAAGTIDGVAAIPGSQSSTLNRPGTMPWQTARAMEVIARDANLSFLRGTYQKPANNATGRQTRGIRSAITTNVFANSGTGRALTKAIFEGALRDMMNNGAFNMGDRVYVLGDHNQIENLADLYASDTQHPISREVVGVSVREIHTTWAIANLVWEPDMNAGELLIVRPEFCRVTAMPIPGKGILFQEPLAKVGSSDKAQLYGELGIDYRHEVYHGLIDDLNN